jgi:uncharacterized RDD family membrane protein YckC
MNCPSCETTLVPGQARCAACGSLVAPAVEGALAPKPEPLRELPGLRKKEKTWREEVNERVRSRRQKRDEGPEAQSLPLFDGLGSEPPEPAAPAPSRPELGEARFADAMDEPMGDLPLRPSPSEEPTPEARAASPSSTPEVGAAAGPSRQRPVELGDDEGASDEDEWPLELQPEVEAARPVERPALYLERLQASAVDVALLSGLWAVVVYFASRAARVHLVGLLPAWPWLTGYLAFLGLAYAAYFTGTTGQTLGKILFSLRVVDTAGQPPGYLRALARAAFGTLSVLAAGLGLLPMAFDPARRALHDRAFRTRVIRG